MASGKTLQKYLTCSLSLLSLFRLLRFLTDFFTALPRQGAFVRNFAIALSGNTLSIVIGFLFTPFLARIYSPDAYGLFAFFISVSQSLAVVATLQLPRAFVLPEKESEFKSLLSVSLLIMVTVASLTSLMLAIFGHSIFEYLEVEESKRNVLVFVLPVAVLLLAFNDVLRSWNIRRKSFSTNAFNQVLSSVVSRGTTLAYGLATVGNVWGLLIGDIVSKVLEACFLVSRVPLRDALKVVHINLRAVLQTLGKYKSYPLFVLPGVWAQSLVTQLPVYAGLLYFSSDVAGYYSFANSLLNLPVNILAGAMAPVFLQKASETYRREPAALGRVVYLLADKLYFIGLLPVVVLMVFGDYIFTFVLGNQWLFSGRLASFMGCYFLFMILNYPLMSLYRIYQKEHVALATNLLAITLTGIGLWIGVLYDDFLIAMVLFSGASASYYLVNIFIILKLVGLPAIRIILRWLGVFAVALLFAFSTRWLLQEFVL